MSSFVSALKAHDLATLRKIPKADLHNHGGLGGKRDELARQLGIPLSPPPARMPQFSMFEEYLRSEIIPHISTATGSAISFRAAFQQAAHDGVSVLAMSIDCHIRLLFSTAHELVALLKSIHREAAPHITFLPCLGINRGAPPARLFPVAQECLETGYFHSIDLYGDEQGFSPAPFRPLFREAQRQGLVLKAHAGEYGHAESVRQAVEILDLDEIQHGIAAATSSEVMRWLHEKRTRLNITPSSNIALGRVHSYQTHPIRKLFDAGVRLSIGTDDVAVFDCGVSEEYLLLYRNQCLTAEELETIRSDSLGEPQALSENPKVEAHKARVETADTLVCEETDA